MDDSKRLEGRLVVIKRILIADDHAIMREGLRHILVEQYPQVKFGEASDGAGVYQQLAETEWDILILDLNMPGCQGLEVLKKAKHLRPHLRIFVLSMYPEDQFALQALRAGALGYMTKEMASTQLIEAIKTIADGKKYISPDFGTKMLEWAIEPQSESNLPMLSQREEQVLRGLGSGKSLKELGVEMDLSPKTIGTYLLRILFKLKLKTNADLVRYAIQNHLIT